MRVALIPYLSAEPRVLGAYRDWCSAHHYDYLQPDSLDRYFKAHNIDLVSITYVGLSADRVEVPVEEFPMLQLHGIFVGQLPDKVLLSASLALFKNYCRAHTNNVSAEIKRVLNSLGYQNVINF